ncbi:MAG: hypothetical protein Unbinned767contig1000_45 [Prokaryotic dsDNA virus sp.]|nr:MAG: hypothetical protein Unbinned767contig1000_45 [Prokaryotic dsDNA virus sp.]|tara:strand:+ start:39511 stop:41052 length:1542 start_codon:yes stop_codon:yes gene_type:complete
MSTLRRISLTATEFGQGHRDRLDNLEAAVGTSGSGLGIEAVGGVPTLGSVNTYLMSNGDGTLSWSTAAGGSSTTFDGLTDAPNFSAASGGEYLRVASGGTTLEWTDPPAAVPTNIVGSFGDMPASWPAAGATNVWLRRDPNDTNQFVFSDLPELGARSLNELTDVDLGTTNAQTAGDILMATSSGWVNVPFPSESQTFQTLSDGPGAHQINSGQNYLRFNQSTSKLEWTAENWPTTFGALGDCDPIAGSNSKMLVTSNASGTTRLVLQDQPTIPVNLPDLSDVPAYPTTGTNYYLRFVNGAANPTWTAEAFSQGATQFSELSDGPQDAKTSGDFLVATGAATSEWKTATEAGIAQSLLDLESLSSYGTSGHVLTSTGSGVQWLPAGGTTSQPTAATSAALASFPISVTDETSTLSTGTAKITFRAPVDFTLVKIKASLTTASSSGAVQVNVNKEGVSVFSTPLTIDANEKTSETAATAAVLGTTAFADDDEITVDIDSAGTGAVGLKLSFVVE